MQPVIKKLFTVFDTDRGISHALKAMWNTMECKRDSFNGSLGGASETHWECVSHCLNATIHLNCATLSYATVYAMIRYHMLRYATPYATICSMISYATIRYHMQYFYLLLCTVVDLCDALLSSKAHIAYTVWQLSIDGEIWVYRVDLERLYNRPLLNQFYHNIWSRHLKREQQLVRIANQFTSLCQLSDRICYISVAR